MNAIKIKSFEYPLALASYLIIALFVFSGILSSSGTIGFHHDWLLGPYSEMTRQFAEQGLYAWNSKYGNEVYHVDWIFRASLIPLSFLNGEALSKGLLIFMMTLSGFSTFCLGKRLRLNTFASFSAGLLYIFSPLIFTRVIAGHFYWLIGYSISPLILSYFLAGREKGRNKFFVISGLLLSFAIIQLQFLAMLIIVLLVFSIVDFRRIKRNLLGLSIVLSIGILINLGPVILSQIFIPPDLPFNPTQLSTVIAPTNLLHGFRLLGWDIPAIGYSYTNLGTSADIFSKSNNGMIPTWIFYLDFLVPIVAFSTLLVRRDRYTIAFALIALIGLFLLKGFFPPIATISKVLFISILFIFRDTWTTSFLYGLSVSFLVAFFLDKIKFHLPSRFLLKSTLPLILISLLIISNGYPLLMRNFGGYLQTYNFSPEDRSVYNNFSSNNGYNILYLPLFQPIKYDELKLVGLDPLIEYSPNHILTQGVGAGYQAFPTTGVASYLISVIRENKTDHLGHFLSGFGIKEIILRKDFVSHFINYTYEGAYNELKQKWADVSFKNRSLEPFLDAQKDLTVTLNTPKYKIYENTNNATKIFPSLNFAGHLSDFNQLLFISNFSSLSNLAAYSNIFDKQPLILLDDIKEKSTAANEFIELGKFTDSVDANQGWTSNRYWFGFNYLLASRVPQGAFSSQNDAVFSFEVPESKYKNRSIEMWMKALKWNKGGNVAVNINGEKSNHSLYSLNQSFELFKVFDGKSSAPFNVTIKNIDGGNYIEGIYIKEKEQKSAQSYEGQRFLVGVENQKNTNNNSNPSNEKIVNATNVVLNPDFVLVDNITGLPLYWNDNIGNCDTTFSCTLNTVSGWRDHTSIKISTNTSNNNTWSHITGKEIDVKPDERYDVVTHMGLNDFAVASHIVMEGFNKTSAKWYQIIQCPSSFNGPLPWSMFTCEVTIPESTSKIRPVLNAGWSSQEGSEATSYFDAIYITKSRGTTLSNPNPEFALLDNKSGLPLYWNDNIGNCETTFSCTLNTETGWRDYTSLKISTNTSNNETWSHITGKEIDVKPDERYDVVTHMGLNDFAVASHIAIEGFNKITGKWYQIIQCPSGFNGPLAWHMFTCEVTIPESTSKIRPVLNAGWSSQEGSEAATYFDAIYISKSSGKNVTDTNLDFVLVDNKSGLPVNAPQNVSQINKLISQSLFEDKLSLPTIDTKYYRANPTLWNIHNIKASKPFILAFAESYDPAWEARIYKNGKKIDTSKSIQLYGTINSFKINQTGDLDIELRYLRQDWFEIGLLISLITIAFCIGYLFLDWKRNRKIKGREISE